MRDPSMTGSASVMSPLRKIARGSGSWALRPVLLLRQPLMLKQEVEHRLIEHCRLLDVAQVAGRRNNDQLRAWDLRLHGAAYGGWREPIVLAEDQQRGHTDLLCLGVVRTCGVGAHR